MRDACLNSRMHLLTDARARWGIAVSRRTKSPAQPCARQRGWSNQELAQLHRAARILDKNGLRLDSDHGVTDEGDPWWVFCDTDTGDVLVHFARIGGQYVACAPFCTGGLTGCMFRDVVDKTLRNGIGAQLTSRAARSISAA